MEGTAGAGWADSDGLSHHYPVEGKQSVFRGELRAATEALKHSGIGRNVVLLIDAQNVLDNANNLLRGIGQKSYTYHEDAQEIWEFAMELKKRNDANTSVQLAKVKSHVGDPLNAGAD